MYLFTKLAGDWVVYFENRYAVNKITFVMFIKIVLNARQRGKNQFTIKVKSDLYKLR